MAMKKITKEYVIQRLIEREAYNLCVDSRLKDEVQKGLLFMIILEDIDTFLSMIWHDIKDSRILTPAGQPRTLHDVAKRVIDSGYDFRQLSSNMGYRPEEHNPEWFRKCKTIYDNYDPNKFDWLALTPPTTEEMKVSPNGIYYIYDGCHKALVLTVLLLQGKEIFRPLECLVLIPRRT
jgi:hypothetical protein